jgi:hypothetical protein
MTDNILTLEKLQEAIDLVYPPLYYGLSEHIDRGVVYLCKETDFNPEYLVCHPDDFHEVKQITTVRRLVHLKDEPKDKVMERIIKLSKQMNDIV